VKIKKITILEQILKFQPSRRLFYSFVSILLVLIFIVRTFLLPYWSGSQEVVNHWNTIKDILDDLFVTVLVTFAVGTFLYWVYGEKTPDPFQVLQPFEIGPHLNKGSDETDIYYFTGGSGRYTRVVTIPKIARNCRNHNKSATIKIQILNPENNELCAKYADYRKGLRGADKQLFWTVDNVKCQLFATILGICVIKTNEPLLEINIGLKEFFSIFRLDLSSNFAIVTFEDQQANGYSFTKGSLFYNHYKEDFLTVMRHNKIIPIDNMPRLDYTNLDTSKIKQILTSIGLGNGLTTINYDMILKYYNDAEADWTKLKSK